MYTGQTAVGQVGLQLLSGSLFNFDAVTQWHGKEPRSGAILLRKVVWKWIVQDLGIREAGGICRNAAGAARSIKECGGCYDYGSPISGAGSACAHGEEVALAWVVQAESERERTNEENLAHLAIEPAAAEDDCTLSQSPFLHN